jgi:hypothetical protein
MFDIVRAEFSVSNSTGIKNFCSVETYFFHVLSETFSISKVQV